MHPQPFSPPLVSLAFVADGGFVSMACALIVLSSPPALALLLAFTSTSDLHELLASSKAAHFPGLRDYMQTRRIDMLDFKLFVSEVAESRLQDDRARLRAEGDALEIEHARLGVFANRLLVSRVLCVECGLVLPLVSAVEIDETGQYLHQNCFFVRSLRLRAA